jgi:hypothetical protein
MADVHSRLFDVTGRVAAARHLTPGDSARIVVTSSVAALRRVDAVAVFGCVELHLWGHVRY